MKRQCVYTEGSYTTAEAADLLGVSTTTVRNWWKNDYISGYSFGERGTLRFTSSCFVDWLKTDERSREIFVKHIPKSPFLRAEKSKILERI